ncbi:MAG: ComF family protein [Armatimonadota bacterium]|nr:ComF family protein [Armatimonadota bacterium]
MHGVWAGVWDLLFPPRCAACGSREGVFCGRCQAELCRIAPPVCVRCGDPLAPASGRLVVDTAVRAVRAVSPHCAACAAAPPAYAVARSLAAYAGPLREAIHAFKYQGARRVADALGALLADAIPPEVADGVKAVVPVPLHASRLRQRGYNQAEALAHPVASRLGVPCLPAALRRCRQEAPQVRSGAAARRTNVAGAFAPGAQAVWATVLLVDDVFSTGATADACAQALRAGGARRVHVLTLARAVLRVQVRDLRETHLAHWTTVAITPGGT